MPCLVTTSDDEEIAGVLEGEESGVQKGSRAGQPRTANLTPPWAVVSGRPAARYCAGSHRCLSSFLGWVATQRGSKLTHNPVLGLAKNRMASPPARFGARHGPSSHTIFSSDSATLPAAL